MATQKKTEATVETAPDYVGPEGKDSAGVRDRVVMASRHADGTPAQSEDFEFIGPKDGVKEAARHQLVSVAHAQLETASDPTYSPSVEDYEKAIEPAEKRADAEVEKHHRGAFDR